MNEAPGVPAPNVHASERLHSLDSLRAGMMLLGVAFHSALTYATAPVPAWPVKDRSTSVFFDLLFFFLHTFRMPLFFVLAGFFARLLYSRLGVTKFVRHRAKRILAPFVVSLPPLWLLTYSGMIFGANALGADPWGMVYQGIASGDYLRWFCTSHLWFLYYLLHFYLVIVVIGAALPRLLSRSSLEQIERAFGRLLASPWRPLLFAVPTCAALFFMATGTMETDVGFIVRWKSLAAYGIFFAFGWMLYRHQDMLPGFQRHAWLQLLLAIALLPVEIGFVVETIRALPAYNATAHLGAIVTGSIGIWLMIFGLIGVAQRYLSGANPAIRYMSDASYWIYLIHLPVVLWTQAAIARWAAPAGWKFAVVVAATLAVSLASYQLFVRYTAIGAVLNGPKRRPGRELPPRSRAAAAASSWR